MLHCGHEDATQPPAECLTSVVGENMLPIGPIEHCSVTGTGAHRKHAPSMHLGDVLGTMLYDFSS